MAYSLDTPQPQMVWCKLVGGPVDGDYFQAPLNRLPRRLGAASGAASFYVLHDEMKAFTLNHSMIAACVEYHYQRACAETGAR